jgi:hypothetical protein
MSSSMAARANREVAPIQSHPYGQSYSEWAAKWWQWAVETPSSVHPLLDFQTQADCSVGQKGKVWFLGATFESMSGIVRECTIPTGTALFFPIVNAAWFVLPTDPDEESTEEFSRAQVQCDSYILSAEIDGLPVVDVGQYLERSTVFEADLPADNIFGIEPQVLSPSVDQGVYLFVRPVSVGDHLISFSGSQDCPFGSFMDGVTYFITVPPSNNLPIVPLN